MNQHFFPLLQPAVIKQSKKKAFTEYFSQYKLFFKSGNLKCEGIKIAV